MANEKAKSKPFTFTGLVDPRGPGESWSFLAFPKDSADRLGSKARVPVL